MLDPTAQLSKICENTSSSIDLPQLRECVAAAADVMKQIIVHGVGRPILTYLIEAGYREAAQACLESPQPIDFTVADLSARTPMHAAVLANTGSSTYNRHMVRALVNRIARCPMDVVDWSQRDIMGRDFISLAAQNQLLSSVWPEVRDEVAYFADNTAGVPLTGEVWAWDWEALEEEDRMVLDRTKASRFLQADRPTGKLWMLLHQKSPSLDKIRKCVVSGANVTFKGIYRFSEDHFVPYPLLCVPLLTGQLPSMEILLATPRPIDFTVTEDEMGDTILHLLSKTQESREEVAWLLSKIIDRVKCHPDDIINWAALNKDDVNPIGSAVAAGFLSVWANTVLHEKPVPYFSEAEHPESILIPDGVDPEDWDHLSPNDKRRFEISTNLW